MILLVTGCPCSGKSVVCKELERYGFERKGVDQFFELGKDKYDPEHSRSAYGRLFTHLKDGDYVIETPGNAAAFLQEKKKLIHYTTVKLDASWETIIYRYQHRWQANDIHPKKLKQEYEDAERLNADIVVNTEGMGPDTIADVIMQRLRRREHSTDAVHKEMFSDVPLKRGKDFLDALLDG